MNDKGKLHWFANDILKLGLEWNSSSVEKWRVARA